MTNIQIIYKVKHISTPVANKNKHKKMRNMRILPENNANLKTNQVEEEKMQNNAGNQKTHVYKAHLWVYLSCKTSLYFFNLKLLDYTLTSATSDYKINNLFLQ